MTPTLAVVGAGKVGAVLARLLYARGYRIATVYSRTYSHAAALAGQVGARAVEQPADVRGDLALLTVPDDAIAATAAALAGFSGKAAVHTSGARDATALVSLAERGVQVGGLHPVYPFTDVESAVAGLPGAAFGIEADDEPLLGWLRGVVAALDGQVMMIPSGGKSLYHAAMVLTSNYTVTLYAVAELLLVGLGVDKSAADHALDSLLAGTVENLRVQGVPDALPGPLVRSDVGTIAAHLRALREIDDQLVEVYRLLARLTYPLLRARGIAPEAVEQVFIQDVEHAHHSS
ncbi:MAG: DUF2520 domain-containing protein [Anaerolineae bacterium]|nr:DUF2520 domain-containing protein [Anaerolineae bacterium]